MTHQIVFALIIAARCLLPLRLLIPIRTTRAPIEIPCYMRLAKMYVNGTLGSSLTGIAASGLLIQFNTNLAVLSPLRD